MEIDPILKRAALRGASDIHLSPLWPSVFRLNTKLVKMDDIILRPSETLAMAKHILGEDKLAILEKDGEIDTSYKVDGIGNFRINIYKHQDYIGIAARVINTRIPSIEELGLPPITPSLLKNTSGLILITGPTGSGKTTSLAAMINLINNERSCHIITIEDPIEYIHHNNKSLITQREIGRDSRSFPAALRAALRQDPDVIMIGEMRDLETISTAITAAETGHLVIATLHTINAPQTIERIIDVFPAYQQQQVRVQLANSLRGVICQRLLPRKNDDRMVLATEVMLTTPAIKHMIREGKLHQMTNTILTSTKMGMHTMETSLQELISQDLIETETLQAMVAN